MGDPWLGPREIALQETMKVAKRRGDFRLGRFVAKRLLATRYPELPLARLEILPDEDGAPCCYEGEQPLPVSLSLSHRGSYGFAAMRVGAHSLGCDLELVEPRSPAFMRDYFTEHEQAVFVAHPVDAGALWANVFWSAKESVLKALRTGLRRDARGLEVEVEGLGVEVEGFEVRAAQWSPVCVRDLEAQRDYHGFWQRRGEQILTLASSDRLRIGAECI
ncbi:MAG: 4'-phosphopantetheinyl transferase superfamily protein [Deltaproteobacteria bacterium]|nr:4'-phosphopantetheinyl transferase superfamily protein [Deltaproteobacteria bacterium]